MTLLQSFLNPVFQVEKKENQKDLEKAKINFIPEVLCVKIFAGN